MVGVRARRRRGVSERAEERVRTPVEVVCPQCETVLRKARQERQDGSWEVVWVCACEADMGLATHTGVARRWRQGRASELAVWRFGRRLHCTEVPPTLTVRGLANIWITGMVRPLPDGCLVEIDVRPGLRVGVRPVTYLERMRQWSGWEKA